MVLSALEQVEHISISPAISHTKWRVVLSSLECELKKIHPDCAVCGPFGFELLFDKSTAPKNIRKFYIYTNNPAKLDRDLYAEKIQNLTLQIIKARYPEIYDHFVLFVRNEQIYLVNDIDYIANEWDKMLDIQIRDITTDILEDYANYIILVHQSFLKGVGEATRYASAHYRGRMLQLLVIIRALYDEYIPPGEFLSLEETIKRCFPFVDNHIQWFCDKTWWKSVPITTEETNLIQRQLLPLCKFIDALIESSLLADKYICVKCYHDSCSSGLSQNLSSDLYRYLFNRVMVTYSDFV